MKLLFSLYFLIGLVKPEVDLCENRKCYTLITKDRIYNHCYEAEIQEYFRTGVFRYNEDLED